MARRRPYRLAGTTTKALPSGLAVASGGRVRTGAQLNALVRQEQLGALDAPLPRDLFPYAFGPGVPLIPGPIDPVRPDTHRPEPRIYDYPVSWNITEGVDRQVPWATLRRAAEMPIIGDCLRIRKAEISTLDWEIGVSARAVSTAQRDDPDLGRHSAEASLRDTLLPEIDRCTQFMQVPDRGNGLTFPQWITELLDERLVLDAVAIYPRRTLGGQMFALEILDGSTIKPLLDHRGGRPIPPEPAYQQVIHGFPRGEFTADQELDDDGRPVIRGGYPADRLIYLRDEVRTFTPYGRSAVERALVDLDTWMKRTRWMRAEYTDGGVPTSLLMNKMHGSAGSSWSPQQLAEYETYLNDYLSGDTRARHRMRVLPPGWEPYIPGEISERYKPEYDLHLLKLVVAHFDMTIHELGFTEAKGLGSDGHAQGQDRLNDRKGSRPTLKSLAAILTDILRQHLGMPAQLEFRWTELAEDDARDDELVATQVAAGLLTVNEGRDQLGRPRFDFPEADRPALMSEQRGTVAFLDQSAQLAPMPGQVVDPAHPGSPEGQPGQQGAQKPGAPTGKPDGPPASGKAAEAAAYRRWAAKAPASGRRFLLEQLRSLADLELHGVDPARVTFLPKADQPDEQQPQDGQGKASGPPGPST